MAKKDLDKNAEQEKEMEALIQASKQSNSPQLGLGEEFQRISNIEVIGDIQNPEKAYELYYKAIYTILRSQLKDLPKEQRDMIYDQKNIFLTRGKVKNERGIRGGDSRQAYLEDLGIALDTVLNWVNEGANPVNLYNSFRDKNKELGYLI
jgi:glutaredoxin